MYIFPGDNYKWMKEFIIDDKTLPTQDIVPVFLATSGKSVTRRLGTFTS